MRFPLLRSPVEVRLHPLFGRQLCQSRPTHAPNLLEHLWWDIREDVARILRWEREVERADLAGRPLSDQERLAVEDVVGELEGRENL